MSKHVATYLNDHLAGSAAALELLTELQARPGLKQWADDLHGDISEDRHELELLMDRLGVAQSRPRQAAAWITEKLAELKTRVDDPAGGPLQLLELLEALALGICGKEALWTALQATASRVPGLLGVDYPRLIDRAVAQRRRVEDRRLAAAAAAFA
jgi:hypothetical protein